MTLTTARSPEDTSLRTVPVIKPLHGYITHFMTNDSVINNNDIINNNVRVWLTSISPGHPEAAHRTPGGLVSATVWTCTCHRWWPHLLGIWVPGGGELGENAAGRRDGLALNLASTRCPPEGVTRQQMPTLVQPRKQITVDSSSQWVHKYLLTTLLCAREASALSGHEYNKLNYNYVLTGL